MLRITSIESEPFDELPYFNAARGGGVERARLPFFRGRVLGLPDGVDVLIATSDLQGIVGDVRAFDPCLLGVGVAERLFDHNLAPRERTMVVLACDLFAIPGKRGGFGPVELVWRAFTSIAGCVVGVAGNHDDVSEVSSDGLLDGDVREFSGLRVGGVGLICGNALKFGRRGEDDQLASIELVMEQGPEVLVLHEGPSGGEGQLGSAAVRELIERAPPKLTVCGHVHWTEPLAQVGDGQVLNVDGRVVVLERA